MTTTPEAEATMAEIEALVARLESRSRWLRENLPARFPAINLDEAADEIDQAIAALSRPAPTAEVTGERKEDTLFQAIAHGDDIHRAWLKQAIADHFAGRPVEPVRPSPDAGRVPEGWFLPKAALNDLQIQRAELFLSHAKRAHEIDGRIRKDAKETWYELDFIKHLAARTYAPHEITPAGRQALEPWCPFCKKPHVGGDTCLGHHP